MIATPAPTNPPLHYSQAQTTDEVLRQIYDFLFNGNAIMTWIHIGIFIAALLLLCWTWRLSHKSRAMQHSIQCKEFALEMLANISDSTGQFAAAFGIGAIFFGVGVWFESKGESGMVVQVVTYCPSIILASTQIVSIIRAAVRIKNHLGV